MLDILDCFQRIYVINLAERTDRRAEMEAELAKVGLSWNAPGVHLFPAIRPPNCGEFPSIGARGCFLSHLAVLKDAQRRGAASVLILEDDVDFSPHLAADWPAVREALQSSPWSFFYGGYIVTPPLAADTSSTRWIPSTSAVQTAHFLGLKRAAIDELIPYLEAMLERKAGDSAGGPMHVDGAYSWFRYAHPALLTLASLHQLGTQRASRTDIHDLRWFDRWHGVRFVAQRLRRLRRWRQRVRERNAGPSV